MSLYNTVMGVCPIAGDLLSLLELSADDFGRFRNCYLSEHDGDLVIVVHTRCGGGNREYYEEVFETMEEHPNYIENYDDDFDCTYADIVFSIPEKYKEQIAELVLEAELRDVKDVIVDNRSSSEKWTAVIDALKK